MSWKDMWEFEKFNAKKIWNQLRDDPERAFIGAIDPVSSKMWGEITGKDYDPMLNQMGGPTGSTLDQAEDSGIDTKWSESSHDAARFIAPLIAGGAWAAGAGAGAGGGAGGAGGAGGGIGGASGGGAAAAEGGWLSGGGGAAGGESAGLMGDMSQGASYGNGINWNGSFGGETGGLDAGLNYTGTFGGESSGMNAADAAQTQRRFRMPQNTSQEPDRTGAQALGRMLQERQAAAAQQFSGGGQVNPFTAQSPGQTAVAPAPTSTAPYSAPGADKPLTQNDFLAMMLEERNKAAAAGRGY